MHCIIFEGVAETGPEPIMLAISEGGAPVSLPTETDDSDQTYIMWHGIIDRISMSDSRNNHVNHVFQEKNGKLTRNAGMWAVVHQYEGEDEKPVNSVIVFGDGVMPEKPHPLCKVLWQGPIDYVITLEKLDGKTVTWDVDGVEGDNIVGI